MDTTNHVISSTLYNSFANYCPGVPICWGLANLPVFGFWTLLWLGGGARPGHGHLRAVAPVLVQAVLVPYENSEDYDAVWRLTPPKLGLAVGSRLPMRALVTFRSGPDV